MKDHKAQAIAKATILYITRRREKIRLRKERGKLDCKLVQAWWKKINTTQLINGDPEPRPCFIRFRDDADEFDGEYCETCLARDKVHEAVNKQSGLAAGALRSMQRLVSELEDDDE